MMFLVKAMNFPDQRPAKPRRRNGICDEEERGGWSKKRPRGCRRARRV